MNGFFIKVSIFLMIFSFVPWLMIPTLPWWPMSKEYKLVSVPVLFLAAEVIFWGGVAIGGAELLRHRRRYSIILRRWLGPRLRRRFHLNKFLRTAQ